MIVKSFEKNKINLSINKLILFYGVNEGAKKENISEILSNTSKENILRYEEKQILDQKEVFFNNILSKSLFDSEKIIIINRASDKILGAIEEIIEKKISDITIIIDAGALEKKSKLRQLFEKKKEMICVAFYRDTPQILSNLTIKKFKEKNIIVSQSNINLIINKCNGDRGVLYNELKKIELFALTNKRLTNENILKLVNLAENHDISELIDNCLAKNKKKTVSILNDNNFSTEDCILITRIFLNKSKKILKLCLNYKETKDINTTISNSKPPIFWKDKEIVKQQICKWEPDQIKKLIYDLNLIELTVKKNITNSVNIIYDFILAQSSSEINN